MPVTITAVGDSRAYDGTTSSDGVPTLTTGALASGNIGHYSQTFDTPDVGSGKTLTPAAVIRDAGDNDVTGGYAVTLENDTTGEITKATATVHLDDLSAVYDGDPHYASATTAPAGLTVDLTYSQGGTLVAAPTAAGSYDVSAVVNDANYQGSTTGTLVISPAGPPVLTRYEQTDHALGYDGIWMTYATSAASDGNFSYTGIRGASVTVRFNGTYLAWIGKTSRAHGFARVTLDGRAPVMVDLYSSATLFRQKVWETPADLTDGDHTLTIECSHTGRPAAIDTNINVDAFDIRGTLISSEGLTRNQQTARLVYSGVWSNFRTSAASFGSYSRSSEPGASVTIPFTGTRLDWVATKGTTLSKADVYVDDVFKGTIDLANSVVLYQQKVFSTGDLADGYHTVKIVRNASDATGKFISIDAVDVQGTVVPLSTRYEQTDTRIVKVGVWSDFAKSVASGKSYGRSSSSDASATIYFTGTRLDWIAMKGATTGIADVYLDGIKVATVDLAARSGTYNVNVWSTGTLANGNHNVRIIRSPAGATGRYLTLDAFDVWGTITTGP